MLLYHSFFSLTWKCEEDPRCKLIGSFKSPKVKLSDAHGHGVLKSWAEIQEVFQVILQNEVEEGTEGYEYNHEFHHECG